MKSWWSRLRRPSPAEPLPPRPQDGVAFETALDQALSQTQGPDPVAAALAEARQSVERVDNMGQSRDERDLYVQLDRLSAAVTRGFPESLCFAGCGRCCRYPTAFFDLHREEWELIRQHFETHWSPQRQQAFIARFWIEHGPWLWVVRFFELFLRWQIPVFPTRRSLPLQCPFLEDERCSVWEVRPFPCRTYGQFLAHLTRGSEPYLYACDEQRNALEAAVARRSPAVMLPDLGPFLRLQYRLAKSRRFLSLSANRMRTIAGWVARTYPRPRRR